MISPHTAPSPGVGKSISTILPRTSSVSFGPSGWPRYSSIVRSFSAMDMRQRFPISPRGTRKHELFKKLSHSYAKVLKDLWKCEIVIRRQLLNRLVLAKNAYRLVLGVEHTHHEHANRKVLGNLRQNG